ncbi:polyadenylate-binding protein 1-B-like [Hyla sarda]|uniref:polyadenylate-binding protein 1-B-like n=1 Tax=Hyla sarda TaxID=327740 RepID=UPI0024C3372D|nr:polyadenylate-binding protein 1-B-like [Hyla sarda]
MCLVQQLSCALEENFLHQSEELSLHWQRKGRHRCKLFISLPLCIEIFFTSQALPETLLFLTLSIWGWGRAGHGQDRHCSMWNPNQGMTSGQPQYAPPPYDMVQSTPSYGQPTSLPPQYSENPPGLSPYGQNDSAPPPYSHLPHAPPGQGYNVTAESNFGSYSSRTNSYPSPNRCQNCQANHESCACQDSRRHHGIIGSLLHGHHEHHERDGHHQDSHRHHERHHEHHRHHGLIGLLTHHKHHESHNK